MLMLSRYIGQKFYIQPPIGDLILIEVMAVHIKNGVKRLILGIQWLNIAKIDLKRQKKMNRVVETLKNPIHTLGQLFHVCDAIQKSLIEKEDLADFYEHLPTATETRSNVIKAGKQVRLSRDLKKLNELCHTGEKKS